MAQPVTKRYSFSWDKPQALVLLILCVAGTAALCAIVAGPVTWIADGELPAPDHHRVALADEKIDPNTASEASLIRLPDVKVTRARRIIAYRDAMAGSGTTRPFNRVKDIENVDGIGAAVSKALAPHLNLPAANDRD